MPAMRSTRRRFLALGALALGAVIVLGTARSQAVRSWLWAVTGEESYFEGLKGLAALTLLELTGPELDLAPDAPLRALDRGPVGVNTFLQLEADPENVRRSYQAMREAGILWARQQFPWEDIEIHGRGDYEDRRNDPPRSSWDKYDRIVEMAAAHGVELLVRLDDPPEWAFTDAAGSGDKGPPDDLGDYASYVAEVVGRYCGRLRYYQLWNEPNIYPEWGEQDVDPAGYAALLHAGAAAARTACPDIWIVSAALAQNTQPGGRNMDDLQYLEALYDAGWQADFDIMAVQAFGLFTGPTDHRVSPDRTNFGRMLLARDIMVRRGDAAKPVWITEMGWTSPPEDYPTTFGRVSEERRAEYTVRAYERIQAEWPWIGPAFLWFLRRPDDLWERAPEGYGYFRLLGPDWAETATYHALRDAATAPPVLGRGRHALLAPAIQFAGPWRDGVYLDGHPLPTKLGAPDAEMQLTFRGTGFHVLLAPVVDGEELPSLFLVVDGDSRTVIPTVGEDGRPRLGAQGLDDGEHLAILRVETGEPQLLEVQVNAPDPASPLAPLLRLAVLGGGLALGGMALYLIWRWRGRQTERQPPPAPSPGTVAPATAEADAAPTPVDPVEAPSTADTDAAAPTAAPVPSPPKVDPDEAPTA